MKSPFPVDIKTDDSYYITPRSYERLTRDSLRSSSKNRQTSSKLSYNRRDGSKQTVRRKSHEKCSKYIKRLAYPGNRAGIYPDSAQSTMGLSGGDRLLLFRFCYRSAGWLPGS